VRLPRGVRPPFEVYVNGVLQAEGTDYEYRDGTLLFDRPLAKEGKLGLWRWFLGAWGIGTYRQNDSVDVAYRMGGKPYVAHALDIEPPRRGREDATGAPKRESTRRRGPGRRRPPRDGGA
jgi:hypothetical protein